MSPATERGGGAAQPDVMRYKVCEIERERLGYKYVERYSRWVHHARPLSDLHRHRYASCDNVCRPGMGAWVDWAPQFMAWGCTLPPPHPPEDPQHLAHAKIPSHE